MSISEDSTAEAAAAVSTLFRIHLEARAQCG
jgi:hypothetical protein